MPTTPWRRPHRRTTAVTGALALIALLVIVQMWLLTATLESYLAGHHDVAAPATIVSAVICGACLGLYGFVVGTDR
jgi:hypothetical protein